MKQSNVFFIAVVFLGLMRALASAQEVEPGHFHHLHLNVVDPERSIKFYSEMFGGVPVKFHGVADSVFTERSFILFNKVDTPAPGSQESGIWHIGWCAGDTRNRYEWLKSRGVEVHTEIHSLRGRWITYFNDPDKVMIEVAGDTHHRFNHIHMMSANPDGAAKWYLENLGLRGRGADRFGGPPVGPEARYPTWQAFHEDGNRAWSNGFSVDNVSIGIYNIPDYKPAPPWWPFDPLKEFKPQRGRAIDHFAISYRDIEPVYKRMAAAGLDILEPITWRPEYRLKSFFVMGPDKVAIEIVEEKPIPEGLWE